MLMKIEIICFAIFIIAPNASIQFRRWDFMERCPLVRPMRNLQINDMMGHWYIIQYYSSTEDTPEYKCMRGNLEILDTKEITMNFTYFYLNDPNNEKMFGNLTWTIPNFHTISHWVHKEGVYDGIYNTFVIDFLKDEWALLMHCAEKKKDSRYLSALLLSRKDTLAKNVKSFLREKLPVYQIDLDYMFEVKQGSEDCKQGIATLNEYYEYMLQKKGNETDENVDLINVL